MRSIFSMFVILALSLSGCIISRSGLETIKQVKDSVATAEISIYTDKDGWHTLGGGTAFAISSHIYLTAGHVCAALQEIEVFFPTRMRVRYNSPTGFITADEDLAIIKLDLDNDLCMLYSHTPFLSVLPFADKSPVLGEKVFIYGSPLGVPGMLTDGYYSHVADCGGDETEIPCFFMTTPATFGNSGSPVLNENGEIVGMLVAGANMYSHITIGVPLESIIKFIGSSLK